MFSFFQNMSLAFNICLCHDLIKTLRDPFSPGNRRNKFYLGFSVIFATAFAIFSQRQKIGKKKLSFT
jgi:hypothetical protein